MKGHSRTSSTQVPCFRLQSTARGTSSASKLNRLAYYFFPIFVFAHKPLQTFFDFNAVYILLQYASFENDLRYLHSRLFIDLLFSLPLKLPVYPETAGIGFPLSTVVYIAYWFFWIVCVVVLYEIMYSFYRRWRVSKSPVFCFRKVCIRDLLTILS
jgi:hypothetical protein